MRSHRSQRRDAASPKEALEAKRCEDEREQLFVASRTVGRRALPTLLHPLPGVPRHRRQRAFGGRLLQDEAEEAVLFVLPRRFGPQRQRLPRRPLRRLVEHGRGEPLQPARRLPADGLLNGGVQLPQRLAGARLYRRTFRRC